jgi:hypothetical protein
MSLIDLASLVLAPTATKEGKVYAAIPDTGDGDLTFTRASSATRVNSAGLIEKVRTNLITYSQDASNANWSKTGCTVTADFAIAPDGTQTADKLVFGASGNEILQTLSGVTSGAEYTFSFYAKTESGTYEFTFGNLSFSLTSGTANTAWQRFVVTQSAAATTRYPKITATSGGTLLIWGFQVESGVATDYIPTTATAVSVGPVANVPRVDYSGGGCPKLLLEPQRSNLVTYSEQINNAAWTKVRGAVTANSTISPSGFQDADTFASAPAQPFPPALTRSPTYTGNTNYTLSIFAKVLGNTNIFSLGYVDNATGFTGGSAVYNLATQVVTITQSPNASVTASMQDYGNGWYRLVLSFLTIASPTFNYFQIGQTTNDVANAFALWGCQLEAGSYVSSYINTLSAASTRVADACFKTGISSLIGQTEGVVFWDIEVEILSATGNENILNIDAGSFGNTIYFSKGANGYLYAEVYVTGVAQCSFIYSLPSVGRYKMALAYKANDFAFYVNGVSRGTDSSGSVPATSRLQMGNGVFGSGDGKVNQAILFKTRLTNTELADLTTL